MKLKKQPLLAAVIALSLTACNEDSVIQNENNNQVEYVTVTARNGATLTGLVEKEGKVESFKGIQYASSGRFEHSKMSELKPKVGKDSIDATQFGAICPQLGTTAEKQSEDCLHLNIWRPKGIEAGADLPVYVFIHGGSFESGSGSAPLNQGDTIVAQGAEDGNPFISVSINYRLGLLGSLWTEDADGGNYGIADQKRALEWVNLNIEDFGGDPGDVTVFGESAGAMSIGILQQDTNVAGNYYQRAIMQSNPYGIAYKNDASAKTLQKGLRDYISNNENAGLFEGKTLDDLSLAQIKMVQQHAKSPSELLNGLVMFSPATSGFLPFAPYVEQNHVTEQPYKTTFTVPTVMGFNSDESNIFTSMMDWLFYYNVTVEDKVSGERRRLILPDFPEQETVDITAKKKNIINKLTLAIWAAKNKPDLQKKLKHIRDEVKALPGDLVIRQNLYPILTRVFLGVANNTARDVLTFADYKPADDSRIEGASDNVAKIRKLANDMLFTCPARNVVKNQSQPTTLYHFDYAPSFNFWPMSTDKLVSLDNLTSLSCMKSDGSGKACHGAELPFVFNKAMDINNEKLYVAKADRTLMETMSRKWFTKALFDNHTYSADNALMINQQGNFVEQSNWDLEQNKGIDSDKGTDLGICEALEANNLLFNYMQ